MDTQNVNSILKIRIFYTCRFWKEEAGMVLAVAEPNAVHDSS